MHTEVVRRLRCPVCRGPLAGTSAEATLVIGPLRCSSGHSFDQARQGYVQLSAGPLAHTGDSATMVADRARFLAAGHFATITEAVRDVAAAAFPGDLVMDIGAGTAHHLAGVLDALPDAWGLAIDAAKASARAATRAHQRADAVVADVWQPLPVADRSVGVVLDVFAPRNAAEFARVLRPDGALVVVTPAADHLAEIVSALSLLTVDPAKSDRLAGTLDASFEVASTRRYRWIMELDHDGAGALVGMGPSAWHADRDALASRISALPEPVRVSASVDVAVYRPRS
jgi:23S rRNA (guanine745-N1)-methyltransferase